jgi:hypothetical protein
MLNNLSQSANLNNVQINSQRTSNQTNAAKNLNNNHLYNSQSSVSHNSVGNH